ncbi:MAG: hypothetical protein ACYTGG_09485 [Planctomycetota bacterium]|jgi:hypothetical protein
MHGQLRAQIAHSTRPRRVRAALIPLACFVAMIMATNAQAGPGSPRPPRKPAAHDVSTSHGQYRPPYDYGQRGRGHKAKRQYDRGFRAGQQAGWKNGTRDGRNFRRFRPLPPECAPGASRPFQVGFHAGYVSAYKKAYRRAQRACRVDRGSGGWNRGWNHGRNHGRNSGWGWNWSWHR